MDSFQRRTGENQSRNPSLVHNHYLTALNNSFAPEN